MSPLIEVGLDLIELGADLRDGKLTDAAAVTKRLMGLIVDKLIPVSTLAPFLSPLDQRIADLAVDIAEEIKVDAAADDAEKAKTQP